MRFLALVVLFCLPSCSTTWHYADCVQQGTYSRAANTILSTADRHFLNRSSSDPRTWWDRTSFSVSSTLSAFRPMN